MENIYVIGASGHAKVVIDILRCMKKNGNIVLLIQVQRLSMIL